MAPCQSLSNRSEKVYVNKENDNKHIKVSLQYMGNWDEESTKILCTILVTFLKLWNCQNEKV